MAQTFEARVIAGCYRFRIVDPKELGEYLTTELTESELKQILQKKAVEIFERDFKRWVRRAKNLGTSSPRGLSKLLTEEW